jgi:glutamate/tyrosine decarboxylase-like PLP-dependent enzyme
MNALHVSDSEFRALAARVTELSAQLLAGLGETRAFPQTSAAQTEQVFGAPFPEEGLKAAALDALGEVLAHSRAPTPRFYGYVLGSGEPVAALADLLASVLNQNVTAWRSAPAAVTIERHLIHSLATALGCPGFTGSLCGGGSLANLMGLAMAREAYLPANEHGARAGIVYASDQVHMSIAKSLALLGLGRENLHLLEANAEFQLEPARLAAAIRADRAAGRAPLAVVASAGTVNTGSIDPLAALAALCRAEDLWLHVDGAYGALAALSVPEKFTGLGEADSLSVDAHKWLYQPLDCGLLLFRDTVLARRTFSFTGDYARSLAGEPDERFAFFDESLELSRRFRALKLWLSLRYHGLAAFRGAIRADLAHAQRLARTVAASEALELLAPVPLSAVVFRHRHGEGADALNAAILARVIARGRVYLSNATVGGRFALRACFVNHRTEDADVDAIVPEVLAAAREVAGS